MGLAMVLTGAMYLLDIVAASAAVRSPPAKTERMPSSMRLRHDADARPSAIARSRVPDTAVRTV